MKKYCTNCWTEIPLYAMKCPHCLSEQPPIDDYSAPLLKFILIIAGIFLFCFLFTFNIIFLIMTICTLGYTLYFIPLYIINKKKEQQINNKKKKKQKN